MYCVSTHTGKAAVQSDEHIQALRFTDLPHDQAVRTHAERFLDEAAQRYFAFALKVWLAALQADDVAQGKLKLKNLLHGDNTLPASNAGRQAVEHGGLACLGGARDQDVESAGDGCAKESG
ncbi:hypothetical protein NCCP2145_10880 [Pseudarthrobacter sp. NCCP-2145]|nr:hypothetical protein NCCP2145_10880 [Pseudarthrobacter sp. NCCP-2145]